MTFIKSDHKQRQHENEKRNYGERPDEDRKAPPPQTTEATTTATTTTTTTEVTTTTADVAETNGLLDVAQNGSIKSLPIRNVSSTSSISINRQSREAESALPDSAESNVQTDHYEAPLVWKNIALFVVLHSCIPAALILLADPERRPHFRTIVWAVAGMYISGLGVTGGAHRLWSHKAYKAKLPVQILLMLLQTMAGQNSIYTWCRDHRVHHKFSETHADPHNIKRGFFFAHMGWLCCKKHPDVKTKGALIDMTDLEANPVVMFQHRHFWWLAILFTVYFPMMLPVWLWNEQAWTSFIFSFMIRYLCTLHGTWLVNSAAHYYGSRPYDNRIEARESPMVILYGLGEGFHNYHHTFPFDYSTSEFGKYFNITTAFIDLCASMGLVYDRRKMDKETILRRQQRTGKVVAGGVGGRVGIIHESESELDGGKFQCKNGFKVNDKTMDNDDVKLAEPAK